MEKEKKRDLAEPGIYTLSNEVYGPIDNRVRNEILKQSGVDGSLVAVGMSGVQLLLIAKYGNHFKDYLLFDWKKEVIEELRQIVDTCRANLTLSDFWSEYLPEITVMEHLNYGVDGFTGKFLKSLYISALEGRVGERLLYELLTGQLVVNSGNGRVDPFILQNHPLISPDAYTKFRGNILNKPVNFLQVDLLNEEIQAKGSTKLLYIDGLSIYNQERGLGFHYVTRRLLKNIGPICSDNTLVIEQGATPLRLEINRFDNSFLKFNPECKSERDAAAIIAYFDKKTSSRQ